MLQLRIICIFEVRGACLAFTRPYIVVLSFVFILNEISGTNLFIMKNRYLLLFVVFSTFAITSFAQPEFTTWGNLTGIRAGGQLMEFETSVCLINKNWTNIRKTEKESQQIRFSRKGKKKTFSYSMDSLSASVAIRDLGSGQAGIAATYISRSDTSLTGAFFRIDLPLRYYETGKAISSGEEVALKSTTGQKELLRTETDAIKFTSPLRQLEVLFASPAEVIVKREAAQGKTIQVYIRVLPGNMRKGQTASNTFTFKATGEVDKSPVKINVNAGKQGRPFDGIGGNFRLQNPDADPQVIDYSLKNLRVAWGRVQMPWRYWHPRENEDPIAAAGAGSLHPRVKAAMEMAQRLDKMGIPVLMAVWSGPDWAIEGPMNYGRQPDGTFGNPLNPEKMQKIYESITSYLLYLKENYGVEAVMFSFNESDLGINIRQTAEEHARLIKGLGAYFASKGLKTKLLLGDTADATGWPFLETAMADEETRPYIGAVSFHSWRGYTDENLEKWRKAAHKMKVPLIVGEGSIDAGAWRYPAIFEEPTYAREEINLYTRILNICEPLSILQWQLTADYSAMSGGGVFGNHEEPLHPTQRFWNLKQLGSTPRGLFALPVTSNKPDVSCAALGDNKRRIYAIHLVNNGATRQVELSGLPKKVKALQIYITDSERGMVKGKKVTVSNGKAIFTLEAATFTSLMTNTSNDAQ